MHSSMNAVKDGRYFVLCIIVVVLVVVALCGRAGPRYGEAGQGRGGSLAQGRGGLLGYVQGQCCVELFISVQLLAGWGWKHPVSQRQRPAVLPGH